MKIRKKTKLVNGVGRNDADYPVYVFAVVGGENKQLWACPIYRSWKNMITRCYSAKEHARRQGYSGCTVTPEWHSFSEFRAWMVTQDWEGNQLDKDILIPGNKVYGPDTCVFVSGDLNNFMTDRGAARGDQPIGVNHHKATGKLMAQCCNPFSGKKEYLGLFTCPHAAHEAWRSRKHELACAYADQQADPRIAAALRSRYASKEEV